MTTDLTINRTYKSSLFRMIFNDPKELLSLYNACNGTDYTNVEDLEIRTLENAIFMKMKNDISFIFGFYLNIYEHQSTVNPNMPLRDLFYVADLLKGYAGEMDIYGRKKLAIPEPKFIVFYNGTEPFDEEAELKLSDLYETNTHPETARKNLRSAGHDLELKVRVVNINEGYNLEIIEACRALKEYTVFTGKIRKYSRSMPIGEAVDLSVRECISEGILRNLLTKERAEVIAMCLYEYNEEQHLKTVFEEGQEDGFQKGRQEGREEGRLEERVDLARRMLAEGLSIETVERISQLSRDELQVIQSET